MCQRFSPYSFEQIVPKPDEKDIVNFIPREYSRPMQQEIFHYIIRVPKKESAFTYFQLEACEGLAFYSTLEHFEGQDYRDLEIKGDKKLQEEFLHLIDGLRKKFPLEILKEN